MFRWYLGKAIRRGRMVLVESGGRTTKFGESGEGPPLTLRVHERRTMWRLSINPNLALGEAYMDGSLTVENGTIRDVIGLIFDNMSDAPVSLPEEAMERPFRFLLRRLQQYNPMVRSRRNVAHHYDLSHEQLAVANERARAKGMSDRVRFYLRDYRVETGVYDRVVSVGMFEHVGVNHYPTFFTKLNQLLAPDGVALVHSIGRLTGPGRTNAWIRKYIFPGGYAPALSEVLPVVERSGLLSTDIELLRMHYAMTIDHWTRRFQANRAEIARLYDERFCRMFEFYLAGAEMDFRYLSAMVFQLQMTKSVATVPLTRDYVTIWEKRDRESAKIRAA